jgi:hypothetical protein
VQIKTCTCLSAIKYLRKADHSIRFGFFNIFLPRLSIAFERLVENSFLRAVPAGSLEVYAAPRFFPVTVTRGIRAFAAADFLRRSFAINFGAGWARGGSI